MTHFIQPNRGTYNGHFSYAFQDGAFKLGGLADNKAEALVRLGVMPHNNTLMNKVINALGDRVLQIMHDAPDKLRPRELSQNLICQTTADEAEWMSAWVMVEILSVIKPLEQLTGNTDFSDLENRDKIIFAVKFKLSNLKKHLSDHFTKQLGESEFVKTLDQKLNTLIVKALEELENCPDFRADPRDHQIFLRNLLRRMMNDFELLQADISKKQRGLTNLFSIANATNTEATQKAYYAIQNHVYSAEGCHPAQLWISAEQHLNAPASQKVVDTAQYPDMRQEDALFAACLIETANVDDAKQSDESARNKIKTQHTALKEKIDAARVSFWGRMGLFRDSSVAAAMDKPLENKGGFWLWWDDFKSFIENGLNKVLGHNYQDEQAKIAEIIETDINTDAIVFDVDSTVSNKGSDVVITTSPAFDSVKPAYVYKPGDFLSASTTLVYEFGEYFSREMGAKHPGISTVGFVVPSAYLASIALSGIGLSAHFMTSVYTSLSKLLSANGHLVNAEKMTNGFRQIDHAWLWVTKCHGTVETIIMTAFGAPKLTYLITEQVNKILSGVPETTINAMMKMFNTGALDTALPADELRERLKTYLKTILMLSLVSGLGVGAAALPHAVPGASMMQEGIEIFDNIHASTFAAIAHGHGFAEVGLLAQLTAEVKTSGLFLAKMMGVSHFLRQGHEKEDQAAIAYFINENDKYLSGDYQIPLGAEKRKFLEAKAILEDNIAVHPHTKQLFSTDFLNRVGVRQLSKPPLLIRGLVAVAKVVGGVALLLAQSPIAVLYFLYRECIRRPIEILIRSFSDTGNEKSVDPVPDGAISQYFYKNGAKVLLSVGKAILGVGYGAKFFIQAGFGFAGRVLSGVTESVGTLINAPFEFVDRWKQKSFSNAVKQVVVKQIGVKLLGGLFSSVAELVGKALIVATSPILAASASLSSAVSYFKRKSTQESFAAHAKEEFSAFFASPWKKLSQLRDDVKDAVIKLEENDPYQVEQNPSWFTRAKQGISNVVTGLKNALISETDAPTAPSSWARFKRTVSDVISHPAIAIKNAVGRVGVVVREYTVRVLEHRLQEVVLKQENDRKEKFAPVSNLPGESTQLDAQSSRFVAEESTRSVCENKEENLGDLEEFDVSHLPSDVCFEESYSQRVQDAAIISSENNDCPSDLPEKIKIPRLALGNFLEQGERVSPTIESAIVLFYFSREEIDELKNAMKSIRAIGKNKDKYVWQNLVDKTKSLGLEADDWKTKEFTKVEVLLLIKLLRLKGLKLEGKLWLSVNTPAEYNALPTGRLSDDDAVRDRVSACSMCQRGSGLFSLRNEAAQPSAEAVDSLPTTYAELVS